MEIGLPACKVELSRHSRHSDRITNTFLGLSFSFLRQDNAVSLCQQVSNAFVLQKCDASNVCTHLFAAFHLAIVSSFTGAVLNAPTLHGLVVPTKPISTSLPVLCV